MYKTKLAENADVVIANSYPDESQMGRSLRCSLPSLKEGGDLVLIIHSPDGQVLHQYSGRFGTDYGGRNYKPGQPSNRLDKVNRIVVMAPCLSKCDRESIGPVEKITLCRNWSEVLADLCSRHGAGTKAAVYPYAALQNPA